jgi:hypothetical protein
MSAFGGKADLGRTLPKVPLMTTDLQRKRARRYRDRARRFRASAEKTKKRTDRPALIQLAQLCDILADGIKAQLRAEITTVSSLDR